MNILNDGIIQISSEFQNDGGSNGTDIGERAGSEVTQVDIRWRKGWSWEDDVQVSVDSV